MHRSPHHSSHFGLALFFLAIFSTPGFAGSGKFDSASKKFNMVFSLRWNASSAELTSICNEIQTASGILLDATDGGNQFGIVLIANGSTASNAADYWILNQNGTSSAPTCTFGTYGNHVTLYRGAAGPAARWEEVIIHETAHFVYCVRDEYEGPVGGTCGSSPCNGTSAVCIGNGAGSACLMEGPDSNDSEFCWSGNHDPDADTEQHCDKCQSCWETIVSKPYGVVAPVGAPTEAAPPADPIACIFLEGTPRIMLVLDRSGSMAGSRLADAQKAARMVVDLAETGTYLGVASFSDGGGVNSMLQTLDNSTDRTNAKNAINGLLAGGNTNYSAGLDAAHQEFIDTGIDAANKSIIFLSDGANNRPLPDPDGTLFASIADLVDDNIVVNTIGIGGDLNVPDEDRLRDMAEDTGGEYARTPIGSLPKAGTEQPSITALTLFDLKPNFARAWAASEERTENRSMVKDIPNGQVYCDTVSVDETALQVTFLANWISSIPGQELFDFYLEAPDGTVIDPSKSGSPGVLYVEATASQYAFFKISPPVLMPGLWKMCFLVRDPELTSMPVACQVFTRSPDIWTTCGTRLPRAHGMGEDVLIQATAFFQAPLSDHTHTTPENVLAGTFGMNATLLDASGNPLYNFEMKDDGSDPSGDEEDGDGVFTGRIPAGILAQQRSGSYGVCIDILNDGGAMYAGAHAKPMPEDGLAPTIPLFVRRCCTSFVYNSELDPTSVPNEAQLPSIPSARIVAAVPNPFNPGTRIDYELARESHVRVDIYNVNGRLVRSLVHGRKGAGPHSVTWNGNATDGTPAPSGVYFAVLRAEGEMTAHKLQLLR